MLFELAVRRGVLEWQHSPCCTWPDDDDEPSPKRMRVAALAPTPALHPHQPCTSPPRVIPALHPQGQLVGATAPPSLPVPPPCPPAFPPCPPSWQDDASGSTGLAHVEERVQINKQASYVQPELHITTFDPIVEPIVEPSNRRTDNQTNAEPIAELIIESSVDSSVELIIVIVFCCADICKTCCLFLKQAPPKDSEPAPHGELRPWALEPWEAFEFDAEAWSRFLTGLGVDENARMSVFLLAQLGEHGKHAANTVIHKCVKMLSDGTWVRNWSAYVHKNCLSARHQLWE